MTPPTEGIKVTPTSEIVLTPPRELRNVILITETRRRLMTPTDFKTAFNDAAATAKVMTAVADKAHFEEKTLTHEGWTLANKKASAYFESRIAYLENISSLGENQ
jgi:hypothetical protein